MIVIYYATNFCCFCTLYEYFCCTFERSKMLLFYTIHSFSCWFVGFNVAIPCFFIAERCSFNLCAGLTLNASLFWLPNHQIGISDDSIRLYYLVYVWNWEKRCKWLKHIKRLRSHFQSHMRDGTSITIGRFWT